MSEAVSRNGVAAQSCVDDEANGTQAPLSFDCNNPTIRKSGLADATAIAGRPLSLPGIDIDSALLRLRGNWKKYSEFLHSFRRKYADSPNQLSALLDAGDFNGASELAHALKGVGGNLGMKRVWGSASSLEDRCRHNDAGAARAHMTELQRNLVEVFYGIDTLQTSSQDDSHRNNKRTVDVQKAMALLAEIDSAIESDLGEAETLIEDLSQQISGSSFTPQRVLLVQAFRCFDWDAVRIALFELNKQLKTISSAQ